MAKTKNNTLMTGQEIADTFNDRVVLGLEDRQRQIIDDIRLGRVYIYDIDDADQAALNLWVEDLLKESRENTDKIRETTLARSESVGMKVR